MGISRRVEYVRWCDSEDCITSTGTEAADWSTRQQAEEAAVKDGWMRIGKHWFCRECMNEMRRQATLADANALLTDALAIANKTARQAVTPGGHQPFPQAKGKRP